MAPSSKVLGAFLLLAVLVGCAAAGSYVNVFGDRVYHAKNRKEYIRTYVRLPRDHDSRTAPTAVGVEWTVGFLKNINRLEPTINQPIENGTFQYVAYEQKMRLPLAGGSPFQFVKLGWNYNGHPPVGIYDIPHADMHFMFPSVEEWHSYYDPTNMGPCGGANQTLFLAATQPLLKKCFPGGGYMNVGNFVWDHGIHNYDVTGPEFNPAPKHFNQTLIYGTHSGKIAFMEPMVGAAMMMKQGKTCYDIRSTLPQEWPTARYIPTEYCLSNNGRTFNTEFRRFKWMTAGCVKGEQDEMVSWPAGVPVPGAEAGCMAAMP